MANSKFVVDTGLVVGPLTIFAANGDIRTSGNIVYTGSGPDNQITAPGAQSGFTNSNTLYFPFADYNVVQRTVDGVVTTIDDTNLTTVTPSFDAFGVKTAESALGTGDTVDIYDCMEPSGSVETTDLGELT
jgi:hypothetical protein